MAGTGRFYVNDLQAVEPDELEPADGIEVVLDDELDGMGFNRVTVYGPTPEDVVEYVRREWGDEDPEWFEEYVVARVVDTHRNVGELDKTKVYETDDGNVYRWNAPRQTWTGSNRHGWTEVSDEQMQALADRLKPHA